MAAPAAPVPAPALGGPRAYAVWIAAVTAYSIAVLQRTTMGVAGLEAADRFGASATIVSTFVVLQLGVYALAQIPAGVLLDRYGSRVTLTAGAVLMALGQGEGAREYYAEGRAAAEINRLWAAIER